MVKQQERWGFPDMVAIDQVRCFVQVYLNDVQMLRVRGGQGVQDGLHGDARQGCRNTHMDQHAFGIG